MKHILSIGALLCILYPADVWAGTPRTKCYYGTFYTTCNAGYYLSGSYCNECPAGTYKVGTNANTSCDTCPPYNGVATSSAVASTAITDCFVPSGTVITDTKGTYTITADCRYSN